MNNFERVKGSVKSSKVFLYKQEKIGPLRIRNPHGTIVLVVSLLLM